VYIRVSNTRPATLFGKFQLINIYVAKCLEKRCRETIESNLNDTQCGFRPGRSTTDQIFTLQQIFEKSREYAKEVYTCFVDFKKAYDLVPCEKLWGVLQVYSVDGRCYWPSSHCIPDQKFFSVSGELNHDRSPLVLDSDKVVCCHNSFSQSNST